MKQDEVSKEESGKGHSAPRGEVKEEGSKKEQ